MSTDSTQRFSNRVDDYVKYRPSYPQEAVDFIISTCQLTDKSIIADFGSGTGIFSKLLLDKGYKVYGIEPNEPMRQAAEQLLDMYSNFVSVDGSSEQSTLAVDSVDLITAATAFHWFKKEGTKAEFKRILKPDGSIAILKNLRKTDVNDFAIAYEKLLSQQPEYGAVNDSYDSYHQLDSFFAPGSLIHQSFINQQDFDLKGLAGRAWSSSYVPKPDTVAGNHFYNQLVDIFNRYQVNSKVSFIYDTVVYIGKV